MSRPVFGAVGRMTEEHFSDQLVSRGLWYQQSVRWQMNKSWIIVHLLPADYRGGTVLARSCLPRRQCEFTTDIAGFLLVSYWVKLLETLYFSSISCPFTTIGASDILPYASRCSTLLHYARQARYLLWQNQWSGREDIGCQWKDKQRNEWATFIKTAL